MGVSSRPVLNHPWELPLDEHHAELVGMALDFYFCDAMKEKGWILNTMPISKRKRIFSRTL